MGICNNSFQWFGLPWRAGANACFAPGIIRRALCTFAKGILMSDTDITFYAACPLNMLKPQLLKLPGRKRLGKYIPLYHVAANRAQVLHLLRCLNTFSHHLHMQPF